MKLSEKKTSKTFTEVFDIILKGNEEVSRQSAREVRELLYGSHNRGRYEEIKKIIENAPEEYHKIKEDWREENFVIAVSVLYFLHSGKDQDNFLFPWIFQLLRHKNGNIRQSAVRMISNDLGPLTVHLRCPEYKQDKLRSEQSDFILEYIFVALNNLLFDFWKPEYKKYKYVDSLPTCPYKSIHMVLSKMEAYCGEKYLKQIKNKLY